MKIKVYDDNHQPFANQSVRLQVKGKDSGTYSFTTNASGELELDAKYKGQQIAIADSTSPQWTTAGDGASLTYTEQETTGSYKY